jgi:hypothetical protein
VNNRGVPRDMLPTLIIGLGGTGYQVIKRLKQLFNKRYGDAKLPVRYLLIDTDLKSFLDDTLDNNEKCQLRFGEGIKNTLDWAYNNPNFEWMPQNPRITPDFFTSTDQGAGLMRPIGRLYLCKNAKLVYDILSMAKNDLVDIHKVLTDLGDAYLENIDRHKVYIVGSLAGGTGCGTFLDVSVMLSNIFNRDTTNLVGMFTLESCYDDKLSSDLDAQNRSKANCYAALKELEFYMSSITNPEDKKYTFKYSNIGELKLEKKLLDVCYLIENRNEMGGVLTNIEDIYDLCSLQLFQEVGTTLGSQLRADYANFICKDKDPILKKDRHFSTFASSSMVFPIDGLKRYCIYKFAEELLERLSQDRFYEEQVLEEEAGKLLDEIDSKLEMDIYLRDFVNNLKLSGEVLYEDLNNRKGNLDKVGRTVDERKKRWLENRDKAFREVGELLYNYLGAQTAAYGVRFVNQVLRKLESKAYGDFNESTINSNSDKEKVKSSISGISDKRILKGKEPVDSSVINEFNGYMVQEQKKFRNEAYRERYSIIKDSVKKINDGISVLLGYIGETRNDISNQLNRMSYQSQKKYGGNIISREMVSKEFYDNYYKEKFEINLDSRVAAMFKDRNLIESVKKGPEELLSICTEEFERVGANISIMDIMARNAASKGQTMNEYVKNELDTAARLAKPFWSAVKNPEVAWTECYYIGSIKDEDMNNGYTIKPPEAIDRWIRNQTGERSRQARYVPTTNPYAIDVIHITMGACAAYLPDVKHYKQFYLKLIASKTYPLHLDERYIGLAELDLDTDIILEYYSLAKAYGVILEIESSFFLNLKILDDKYCYIYQADNCLRHEAYFSIETGFIPEKENMLPENLKLGNTYGEVIQRINENSELSALLRGFLVDTKRRFNREELREHCLNYVRGRVSEDFIAKEKITHKMAANQA